MGEHLGVDEEKLQKIIAIKLDYLQGTIDLDEAKKRMKASVDRVTPDEFAICEQYLEKYNVSDDTLVERMEDILKIFDGLMVYEEEILPVGHPIQTYRDEVKAIRKVLDQMRQMKEEKFIKNPWLEIYEKLSEINVHFSRKQNQLYPALERKGFNKPSKVMWTLENDIKDGIKKARHLLLEDQDELFMQEQDAVINLVEDMMVKEQEILYPTSLDLLEDEDFIKMSASDREIGFCLIDTPPLYEPKGTDQAKNIPDGELMKDLMAVFDKHGILKTGEKDQVLDVSQGKLTLEQINLIFKHLQVDLSYVDENDIVKFYSDTKHRVFPRSAGVIGREVQNCHPRESVHTVEEIIRAFREGEHDKAEFWLEIGGKFIYIIYNAVRDENGRFRGVLEMMQDVTHIRSLTGSQRLLSWGTEPKETQDDTTKSTPKANPYNITKDSNIGELIKKYPYIKNFLLDLSPKFSKLKNPVLFKTMSAMATIEMISQRGGFDVEDLIDKIVKVIEERE